MDSGVWDMVAGHNDVSFVPILRDDGPVNLANAHDGGRAADSGYSPKVARLIFEKVNTIRRDRK